MTQTIGTSNLIDTWADGGAIEVPSDVKKNIGWEPGEQPPAEFMNWLQNTFGSKINHLLKNGLPLWNGTTPWDAGAFVQHDGQGWQALNNNANSAPSDGNLDWTRIATKLQIDALLQMISSLSDALDALSDEVDALSLRVDDVTASGWGERPQALNGSGVNLNDYIVPGNYLFGASCVNLPFGNACKVIVFGGADGSNIKITQLAQSWAADDMFFRRQENGTWGAWRTLLTTGNAEMTGQVVAFATTVAPAGYLKCDGAAVSRTTYAALFAKLGTTWGAGNGTTTFNLPDLRGEFIRGADDGRGLDTGRVFGSVQNGTLVPVSNGINPGVVTGLNVGVGAGVTAAQAREMTGTDSITATDYLAVDGSRAVLTIAVAASGEQIPGGTTIGGLTSGAARPRNVALLYYIKF